jgi:hypothetical protein
MKYYAGIGSRETPVELKEKIKTVVEHLNQKNYTLRSGGAQGADSFFEEFASKKEIYLPWMGFNNNTSLLFNPTTESFLTAERYHPRFKSLSNGAKKLMARNCHQVLGLDLKTPVDFVVCWTKNGTVNGGTGQALRIAEAYDIPVYNLFFEESFEKILENT